MFGFMGTGTLTGSAAQTNATQDAGFNPVSLPDRQLRTGLPQVTGVEAVVHHGVVVGGADGVLDQPRLLTALATGIWEYVACGLETRWRSDSFKGTHTLICNRPKRNYGDTLPRLC